MTTVADPDYWSLLGLEPGSDADQLKQAFRREARRWHPDLNGNDPIAEERFKLVMRPMPCSATPADGRPGKAVMLQLEQGDPFERVFQL